MRLIDLSHTIEEGLITYRGLPAPLICDFLSHADSRRVYAEGTEFAIGATARVGNTGTCSQVGRWSSADWDERSSRG